VHSQPFWQRQDRQARRRLSEPSSAMTSPSSRSAPARSRSASSSSAINSRSSGRTAASPGVAWRPSRVGGGATSCVRWRHKARGMAESIGEPVACRLQNAADVLHASEVPSDFHSHARILHPGAPKRARLCAGLGVVQVFFAAWQGRRKDVLMKGERKTVPAI
jgi:hypothetical protein